MKFHTFQNSWRLIVLLFISLLMVWPVYSVSGHSADMYIQEQFLIFDRSSVQIEWKITPGPLLAYNVWSLADHDQDSSVSQFEADNWAITMLPYLKVMIDGQSIDDFEIIQVIWPDDFLNLQTGDQSIKILLAINLAVTSEDSYFIEWHNTFEEMISFNWFSIISEDGLTFYIPQQKNGFISFELLKNSKGGEVTSAASTSLASWESGRPSLPDLSGSLSQLSVSLANTNDTAQLRNGFSQVTEALTSLVRSENISISFLLSAFLLCLALGSLHALTPGHGKTLVAAYLVGSRGRVVDAIFLGIIVTVTHTGSVLLLGLVSLVASRYIMPSLLLPVLEVISGFLVVGFGIHLLSKRIAELRKSRIAEREKKKANSQKIEIGPVIGDLTQGDLLLLPHSLVGSNIYKHSNDHVHIVPGHEITWKSLLALGVSGGLVPCPDAIAILLVAVAIHRILFGMALIVAFSLGLALVLIGIGVAMVNGAKILRRTRFSNVFGVFIPVISAVAVLTLGIGLSITSIRAFYVSGLKWGKTEEELSYAVSQPTFDLQHASLIYLAPDTNQQNQIFRRSLLKGDPIQLTQELEGVSVFQLSPDNRTILFTVVKSDGTSSFHSILVNGSQDRLLFNCSESSCVDPTWFPDGKKIFYNRYDFSDDSSSLFYTIWWLDVQTGETQPLFQDGKFPAFTPSFSTDGKWLGYISPSTSSIHVYSLVEDRKLAIENQSGVPPKWNPEEYQFLYWEIRLEGSQSLMKLKLFDVNQNKTIDLSQDDGYNDFLANWSPDGAWIAVSRGGIVSPDSSYQESIWLVKSDGSQFKVLIDHPERTYGEMNWSSDGRYLLFSSQSYKTQPLETEVWLKDLHTGQEKMVMTGGSQHKLLP